MITVIGSINMDLVVTTDHMPMQGETVFGKHFHTVPGGKGANQAVAAAKLGAPVNFIGAVGQDVFGDALRHNLHQYGIAVAQIAETKAPTGIASIIVHDNDNRIIVVPGANAEVTEALIDTHWAVIANSQLVVMQLEIPPQTVDYVLKKCAAAHIDVLLNPAPATNFSREWVEQVTFLTPNEMECQEIFAQPVEQVVASYPNRVIVTLGSDGACYHNGTEIVHIESYQCDVVDTTGAGDTFNGAFAYATVNGHPLDGALRFANAAASLSVEQFGAQGGMPTHAQVLNRQLDNRQYKGEWR